MTVRIQCPACQRQFQVSEELKGRTVECGGCEKRFVVDEDAILPERERYFPGDIKKPGLAHYGNAPAGDSAPPVQFETAIYNENATAADVVPPSPGRTVAGVAGMMVLVLYLVLLVFGVQGDGSFSEMERGKRIVLSGFVVVVGLVLVLLGGVRRRKQAALGGMGLAVAVLAFSVTLPEAGPPQTGSPVAPAGPAPVAPETAPARMSEEQAMTAMGYDPVERAIVSFGQEAVWALWAPEARHHFRYQIQRYLQRKTGVSRRPAVYARGAGCLLVLENVDLKMPELMEFVERFAQVEEVYEDLRVLRIAVIGENLVEPSTELESRLGDETHGEFIELNRQELDHINIDRVKDAAQRLSMVEPSRFRPEIAGKLIDLLEEDTDTDFRATICQALTVWSLPGEGAEATAARIAQRLVAEKSEVPKSMIQLLIDRKAPELPTLLRFLWRDKPLEWESELIATGGQMESVVIDFIESENRILQRSAFTILRRIGTEASIPALREALDAAGEEKDLRRLIQRAIEAIEDPEGALEDPVAEPMPEPATESAPAPDSDPNGDG